jgi:hypothetical protein
MGIEPTGNSPKKTPPSAEGGAESGAFNVLDPDLDAVIDAWPGLPEPIRRGILAMIRAGT